ncbi:hypothetical protein [Hoeflea sp.]|uniref:hypothetical protein n=1 Tax=Hoeflea sp. TaxID=1940281 RepID=UPI003B02E5CC
MTLSLFSPFDWLAVPGITRIPGLSINDKGRPAVSNPRGPLPMQLRYPTGLTGERYVTDQAWHNARLDRCPNHPHGGCSFARHGTYERKTPAGVRVSRWYCPQSHTTFSLLPDFLAARFPGTLNALEAVVVVAQEAVSQEAAANEVRCPSHDDAIALPGALRWLRRRVDLVHNVLAPVIGLIPDKLAGCAATMSAVRAHLKSDSALMALRGLVAGQLRTLPAPLGFQPHGIDVRSRKPQFQQRAGPDPPPVNA